MEWEMNETNVSEKVKGIFAELFDIEENLYGCKRFKEDYELDSIDMVNLQVEIEDNFNIKFDPINTDLSEIFVSIDTLTQYIISLSKLIIWS